MKVLFVSNLFPDDTNPYRGLVNATLLHHLKSLCEVRVLALRPTLPIVSRGIRRLSCRVADECFAPEFARVPYIPKIGSRLTPRLYARSLRPRLAGIRRHFHFDAILCAWMFPDGVAVTRLAEELGCPIVLVAQGTDTHDYLERPSRRRLIVDSVQRSHAVITRSADLAYRLQNAGAPTGKLETIYNGVNSAVFCPGDQQQARARLNLPAATPIMLSVGNLVAVKNPHLALAAHALRCRNAGATKPLLLFIGSGPLERKLKREAAALGIASQVRWLGSMPSSVIAEYMQAADLLVMSSDNEGVPNVILEALACGLRVASTNVGGISEVLPHESLGQLVPRGDAPALAAAQEALLARPAERAAIASHMRPFTWQETAAGYHRVLTRAVAKL